MHPKGRNASRGIKQQTLLGIGGDRATESTQHWTSDGNSDDVAMDPARPLGNGCAKKAGAASTRTTDQQMQCIVKQTKQKHGNRGDEEV